MGGRSSSSGFRAGGNAPAMSPENMAAMMARRAEADAETRRRLQGTPPTEADMKSIRSAARRGIASHTREQNDQAERNIRRDLDREEEIARNYRFYIANRTITSESDPWWQEHQRTLGYLRAQLAEFERVRRRTGM